ncbi:MAG TPA: hypothetical protein PLC38_03050 [Methanobacterium sp.]|nr:MAG: hypothetical protein FGO69_09820 [Methanobacterium sp.]HOI71246.1 hypothetical protein [Methanobacterium sp.]
MEDEKADKLIKTLKHMLEIYKKEIELYKSIRRDYDKMLLWTFKCLKEAQESRIKFDDPNFVDNEIKRLEHNLIFDY